MTNTLKKFAEECVTHYAHYNDLDDFYSLEVSDLPDFVKHEFASLIMKHDEAYAIEATGADNQHWETRMLPALTNYLAHSTDKDAAIHFNNVWRDCVADYMTDYMQRLIDQELRSYEHQPNYYFGVTNYAAL